MEVVAFLKGFGVSFGLIVAIGAQNAYVLTRGICRNHHWAVAMIASLIDAILIMAGILGMGTLVQLFPSLIKVTAIAGAVFLFVYGAIAFKSMLTPGHLRAKKDQLSLKAAVTTLLAVSLLNPHLYLDTVILLSSVAMQEVPENQLVFGFGAMLASFVWFHCLALGGQWMQRWFQTPTAWRILDFVVGIVMWFIAATLIVKLL